MSHRPYHTGFYYGTPAQSYYGEEYAQTCDFVGGVQSCEPAGDAYRIGLMLRNRIYRDDELEVLSPGKDAVHVRAHELEDDEGSPCAIAQHNAKRYSFISPVAFEPLDIIRKRRSDLQVQAGR